MLKTIVAEEKKQVLTLLVKRTVSLKWIEKMIQEIPDTIKNFNVTKNDKELNRLHSRLLEKKMDDDIRIQINKELNELKKQRQEYEEFVKLPNEVSNMEKSIESDIYCYQNLKAAAKEVKNKL